MQQTQLGGIARALPNLYCSHFARPRRERRRLRKPRHVRITGGNAQVPVSTNKLRKRSLPWYMVKQQLLHAQSQLQEQLRETGALVQTLEEDLRREVQEKAQLAQLLDTTKLEAANERRTRLELQATKDALKEKISTLERDLSLDVSPNDVFLSSSLVLHSLPYRLDAVRRAVRKLMKDHVAALSSKRILSSDLERVKESFVERELAWWKLKQELNRKPLAQDFMTFLLQLEFGMVQWKRRGMELELTATHRELDSALAIIDGFADVQAAIAESSTIITSLRQSLTDRDAHITRLKKILSETENSGRVSPLNEKNRSHWSRPFESLSSLLNFPVRNSNITAVESENDSVRNSLTTLISTRSPSPLQSDVGSKSVHFTELMSTRSNSPHTDQGNSEPNTAC